MKRIDLHTHSTASDGTFTPSQLILEASRAELSAIALTDHDTIKGVSEAMETAPNFNIECIPGIELSAIYKDIELHIVGLFLNIYDPFLNRRLDEFQKIRNERNEKMIQKMQKAHIHISMDKLRETDGDAVITRANIARFLMNNGYVSSIAEAFNRFLSPGKPFYVPKTGITPKDAIETIRQNGGTAILAHPLTYKMTHTQLCECIETLKTYGLQGMETYYSTFSEADHRDMKRLADHYGLLHSGGSDFHGSVKPLIHLGSGMGRLVIPYDVLEKMRKK